MPMPRPKVRVRVRVRVGVRVRVRVRVKVRVRVSTNPNPYLTKYNVDTVRAGVVVEDAAMMAIVHEAIGAHVGRFLRSKNAFRADAKVRYRYQACFGTWLG